MLNGLKQLEREMKLRNPENRGIICAYTDAEFGRLDKAVYSPLEKRYPSLRGFFGEMRQGYDPVEKMKETKFLIQMMRAMKGLVSLIDLIDGDEDTQAVKTMLDKIDLFTELYGKVAPIQEQFYVDLARAVKGVSAQRGVGVESIVGDLQYMDEVSRIVIPTRDEAESFLRISQTSGREMLDIGRGIAFAKKTIQGNEEVLENAKLIPTAKAWDVVEKCTWDYKMQEFDRVYSA